MQFFSNIVIISCLSVPDSYRRHQTTAAAMSTWPAPQYKNRTSNIYILTAEDMYLKFYPDYPFQWLHILFQECISNVSATAQKTGRAADWHDCFLGAITYFRCQGKALLPYQNYNQLPILIRTSYSSASHRTDQIKWLCYNIAGRRTKTLTKLCRFWNLWKYSSTSVAYNQLKQQYITTDMMQAARLASSVYPYTIVELSWYIRGWKSKRFQVYHLNFLHLLLKNSHCCHFLFHSDYLLCNVLVFLLLLNNSWSIISIIILIIKHAFSSASS